jgi:threonine aldolase
MSRSHKSKVNPLANGSKSLANGSKRTVERIDLRSDTVTYPTPSMREAMYRAEVGDDVYSEDPSINQLEELAARKVGKEAALFVPSGTMGNAIAMLTHCRRGDEILMGDRSHTYLYEVGGPARLNGSFARPIPTRADGTLDAAYLAASFHGDDIHEARTGLLCLENTHNMCGGRVLSPATLVELTALAREKGIPVHLDGARLFNAAVALGVNASELAAPVNSVMFCLSKGLSAPVGSILAGTDEFIKEARRTRKLLGGGMRQAGILAAAGIVALTEMVDRLALDHANALRLAEGLAELPGILIEPESVQTNILFFGLAGPGGRPAPVESLVAAAQAHGVLVSGGDDGRIRAVTHFGITADEIDHALVAFSRALREVAVLV